MGVFSYLYLVEGQRVNDTVVKLLTTVYIGPEDNPPYFSYIHGERPGTSYAYGNDTIFSDKNLKPHKNYPVVARQYLGEKARDPVPSIFVQAQFNPCIEKQAIICHMVLPERYLPRSDFQPLFQPKVPHVDLAKQRLVLTWPLNGAFDIRFCMTPLDQGDDFGHYDLFRILCPPDATPPPNKEEVDLIHEQKYEFVGR